MAATIAQLNYGGVILFFPLANLKESVDIRSDVHANIGRAVDSSRARVSVQTLENASLQFLSGE